MTQYPFLRDLEREKRRQLVEKHRESIEMAFHVVQSHSSEWHIEPYKRQITFPFDEEMFKRWVKEQNVKQQGKQGALLKGGGGGGGIQIPKKEGKCHG